MMTSFIHKSTLTNTINTLLFLLIILTNHPTDSFIPDALLGVSSPSSVFHSTMTKRAIIQTAIKYFEEVYSETAVKNLKETNDPDEKALFLAVYGGEGDSGGFEGVIEDITDATASVDTMKETKKNPKWHFDSEWFQKGHEHLIQKVDLIVALIKQGEMESARENLGQILHPLQDFYTHSNWVEMGNTIILKELGVKGKKLPVPVALLNEQTCIDCTKDFKHRLKSGLLKVSLIGPLGFGSVGGDEDNIYNCEDNIIMKEALTSGYSVNQKDDDGNPVNKPEGIGKCSHGGVLDGSSGEFAKGGINKDSESSLFSPHDYLHADAAALAETATIHFLNHIRSMLSDDPKWGEFFQLAPGPSLGFIVDVCSSMQPFILSVRRKVLAAIEANEERGVTARKYLIVPFNDREVLETIVAMNGEELKEAFDVLEFNHNCNRSRRLYQAIQTGALKSHVGGYLYATTNGHPSDHDSRIQPWVMATLKKKQIIFRLSLNPGESTSSANNAAGRTGPLARKLLLRGARDEGNRGGDSGGYSPEDLAKFRAFSQSSGGSVSYSQSGADETLDFSNQFTKRQAVLLVAHSHTSQEFPFQVDSTIQRLDVTISGTSAHPPKMFITGPSGSKFANHKSEEVSGESSRNKPHLHRITTEDPEYGVWSVKVDTEEKSTHYTLVVSATTSLTYDIKFVVNEPDEAADHPGVHAIVQARPIAGSSALVQIKPASGNINSTPLYMQFRDSQWGIIGEYRVQKSPYASKGHFSEVTIPDKDFYVRIFGINEEGTKFVRAISVPVQPSSVSISIDRSKRNPAKVDESTGSQTEGPSKTIYFTIENHGPTRLFDIIVQDNKDHLVEYSPKGAIIFAGSSLTGSAKLSIPVEDGEDGNFGASVTDLYVQATSGGGDSKLASNTFNKRVVLF